MITNHLFRSSEYKFSLFASFCTANHCHHVAPYSAGSNTKVLCTPKHCGGCQRRIAKACLGTGCVGGRLKAVCLVPEIEITRSGRGARVHGAVGCDVRGKKVVFKKLKITIVIL